MAESSDANENNELFNADPDDAVEQKKEVDVTTTTNKTAVVSSLPLEWTKLGTSAAEAAKAAERIHFPLDVYDYSVETTAEELIIVGTHGLKITHIGKDFYKTCASDIMKTLILRSHLITKMEGLDGFQQLTTLELYDNQISVLENLNNNVTNDDEELDIKNCTRIPPNIISNNDFSFGLPGRTIQILDLSYNVIRDMEPVRYCPNLIELYLANNKIKEVKGLSKLHKLRKLDLGANRIRTMPHDTDEEEFSSTLEELWLGKNKIEVIQGLEKLEKLRRLDVQANRLTAIDGLTTQVDTLEELYLSHNAIDNTGASQPTGLALPLSKLTVLDLSKNRISSTEPFAHLMTSLEELWLSSNNIENFEQLKYISLAAASGINVGEIQQQRLQGIYLEFNPVSEEFEYRKHLAELIGPSLETIDGVRISGYNVLNQPGAFVSLEDQLRMFQEQAIERARRQQQATSKVTTDNNER